jgi:putative ABC transport system ATP-binding protein
MMGPAMIQLEDVRRTYAMGDERVHALAGVTMTFAYGDFWAIMGASGSGKSTLLNLLGCLDRPSSGRYLFEGQDVSTKDDDGLSEMRLQRIGFIFQSFNLIPQLSVRENIELPLYYQGVSTAESARRAESLAARVGLQDRLGHRPAELSGGQQQRVAIARALANEPRILLADEPTGNLDSQTSTQIMTFLQELNEQGTTIIMVTHEPDIADFAKARLHMRDGVIASVERGRHA